mgnify:CR=1 FL=1
MYLNAEEFGKRLRGLRKLKGMTQEALARKLNIEKQHISRMENGVRLCSIDLLIDLAVVLNTSTDYLLMGKELNKEQTKNELLSVISQLSGIAQQM